jgi:hypothetical protein
LGRAWDGCLVSGWDGAGHWDSFTEGFPLSFELASGRSAALTPASSIQARNTAPIVNSFARSYASDSKAAPTEVTSILEQRIRGVQEESGLAETGRVLSVGYGMIIIIFGTTMDIMD